MKKRYLLGIPFVNIIIVTCWGIIGCLEKISGYWDNPNAAPMSISFLFFGALLFGGFTLIGLICGLKFISKNSCVTWCSIFAYTVLTFLVVEVIYIAFYFVTINDHTHILRDTLIITLQQGSGFFIACCIKKVISRWRFQKID